MPPCDPISPCPSVHPSFRWSVPLSKIIKFWVPPEASSVFWLTSAINLHQNCIHTVIIAIIFIIIIIYACRFIARVASEKISGVINNKYTKYMDQYQIHGSIKKLIIFKTRSRSALGRLRPVHIVQILFTLKLWQFYPQFVTILALKSQFYVAKRTPELNKYAT